MVGTLLEQVFDVVDTPDSGSQRDNSAEAIRTAAVTEAPKHHRILRSSRDGRILSRIMRFTLAIYTPRGHAVLTTTGRQSGKQRRNYVRAIRQRDKVYVVMLRPPALAIERPDFVSAWVWNIRANPKVRLRLGFRVISGIAREITAPAELNRARKAVTEAVRLIDYGETTLHLRGLPSRTKIKKLHCYWFDTGIPLVIDLRSRGQ